MKQANTPLIKKFKTDGNYYIYDTWTNEILKVKPDFWNYLTDADNNSSPDQTTQLNETRDVIESEVQRAKQQGYLSSDRPEVSLYSGAEDWQEQFSAEINHNLGQLTLNITEACNFRCEYCSYSGHYKHMRNHSSQQMTWSIAKKALDYTFEHSDHRKKNNLPLSIGFYGGEPLLNFDLIKKSVLYCQEKYSDRNIVFTLTTNGSLIDEKIANFLIDHRFTIVFSIDGPPHLHDRYRKTITGHPTFKLTMKGYQLIKKLNANNKSIVRVNCLMPPPFNLSDIENFVKSIDDDVSLRLPSDYDTTFYDQFDMKTEYFNYATYTQKIFEEYKSDLITNKIVNKKTLGSILFDEQLSVIAKRAMVRMKPITPAHGQCIIGGRKLFVTYDGQFMPCERVTKKFIIGNVDSGINFQIVFELLENFSNLFSFLCKDCWAVRFCTKCIATIDPAQGINPESFCTIKKDNIESDLIRFCSILELNPNALEFLKDVVIS